jgi:hypothetical protein
MAQWMGRVGFELEILAAHVMGEILKGPRVFADETSLPIPAIGADLMGRTWIADIRTWDAPDPRDDGVSLLADSLCSLVPEHGRIGVPMGLETHLRMPLADYAALACRIAPRALVDGTVAVQRVREVKSEAEIGKIRDSCAIAGSAFARVPEFAQPGRRLDQVFRDFQIALLQEGADWVSYVAGGAGSGGYGVNPSGWTTGPRRSDTLNGHCLEQAHGYSRNVIGCALSQHLDTPLALTDVHRASLQLEKTALSPRLPTSEEFETGFAQKAA